MVAYITQKQNNNATFSENLFTSISEPLLEDSIPDKIIGLHVMDTSKPQITIYRPSKNMHVDCLLQGHGDQCLCKTGTIKVGRTCLGKY